MLLNCKALNLGRSRNLRELRDFSRFRRFKKLNSENTVRQAKKPITCKYIVYNEKTGLMVKSTTLDSGKNIKKEVYNVDGSLSTCVQYRKDGSIRKITDYYPDGTKNKMSKLDTKGDVKQYIRWNKDGKIIDVVL